ncbi:mycothiol-dependent nitroreductase Rv2466c family protein [Mycobacterium camsae]|uniref:mycothiol-dependent nitroreductase Rv2466c family protein n=1 Tax=Mycobacterium gordonae TaxID=1778 RepID=UPI00197CE84A|nr:disulfide bond formation protein DsbA [Mycobacterium gordonae]
MTTIDLYLDPVCPFSWVTSRWLLDAAERTDRPVMLRQMNLAVLNEGQQEGEETDAAHQRMYERSRRLGRVFAAVTDRYGPEAFARLYEPIGTRLHVQKDEVTLGVAADLLGDLGFEASLAQALDEPERDEAVRRVHADSQDTLGDEAGSPIIAIGGRAFFGPVLTGLPSLGDRVVLLDAIVSVASVPEFAALQRPRG